MCKWSLSFCVPVQKLIYIYIYTCIYTYICIYMHIYIYVRVCVCVCVLCLKFRWIVTEKKLEINIINFIGLQNNRHSSQNTVGNDHKSSGNCQ
jgi:hypothetical protein